MAASWEVTNSTVQLPHVLLTSELHGKVITKIQIILVESIIKMLKGRNL